MLELGVDEITLVLQVSPNFTDNESWAKKAEKVIDIFSTKADFINIFGYKRLDDTAIVKGYNKFWTFGEHDFTMTVAINTSRFDMGIVIKFSATALSYYCEYSNLNVYQLLQNTVDDNYTMRLSRIDLTADYIDEDINLTDIYYDLTHGKAGIYNRYQAKEPGEYFYKKSQLSISGFAIADSIPTIYIGKSQSKSNLQARFYDKKQEQIDRNGHQLKKAKSVTSWHRLEVILRHDFAHLMTSELLYNIHNDNEFANLIANTISQKIRIMKKNYVERDKKTELELVEIDCIQMIIDKINNYNFTLSSPKSRNNDLARQIAHIFTGSGIMSVWYKIYTIWGRDVVDDMMKDMLSELEYFEENEDCRYWLQKNRDDYIKNHPNYTEYFKENVVPLFLDKYEYKDMLEKIKAKREEKVEKIDIQYTKSETYHVPPTLDNCMQNLIASGQLDYDGYYMILSQFTSR